MGRYNMGPIRGHPVFAVFLYSILVLAIFMIGFVIFSWATPSSKPQIIGLDLSSYEYGPFGDVPVNRDSLLVFAIRVSNISFTLNKAVKEARLDLPRIKLEDINRSCRERNTWFYVDENIISIYLCSDIASKLNKDEVMAYSVHEIGHVYLGHITRDWVFNGENKRDIEEEKEADNFVVESGISPRVLASAINKLAPEGQEKNLRLATLEELYSD